MDDLQAQLEDLYDGQSDEEPQTHSEDGAGEFEEENSDVAEEAQPKAEEVENAEFELDDLDQLLEQEVSVPPPRVPSVPAPPRKVSRPEGIQRSMENRVVLNIPGAGELHYYRSTQQMHAFCALRNSTHSSGCRKQMTCAPAKRGTGRPLGFLIAWMRKAGECDSKHEHVHCCIPSLEERRKARELFNRMPEAAEWSSFENAKDSPNDPDEPVCV